MQRVFLVHGWSVTATTTYGALHKQLEKLGFVAQDIYLGRYVSLDNRVTVRDVASAMHHELQRHLGNDWSTEFHLITHSTGALIVKDWIANYYTDKLVEHQPLQNVIFLAGPHFGSRLAHHGRSMVAHAKYKGDTGTELLKALELGSRFSWDIHGQWLRPETWKDKGIRPFNLIGDRVVKRPSDYKELSVIGGFLKVVKDEMLSALLPAHYEAGSDMTVRVPAGNLNFKRFLLSADPVNGAIFKPIGSISDIPFGALYRYTHSDMHGIMSSIKLRSKIESDMSQNLRLIRDCLSVDSDETYTAMRQTLTDETLITKGKRGGAYSQLDIRVSDTEDHPIEDYRFMLGYVEEGKLLPSKTVSHTHQNKVDKNHLTLFLDMSEFNWERTYYAYIDVDSGTPLVEYHP
ncbi:MAG: hypothetical protein ABIE92_10035, partial [bacterium]